MFKTLIFAFFTTILTLNNSWAEVSMRWFGVASFVLEDSQTRIFFDPMFTRAGVGNWLGLFELRSDEELVKKMLQETNLPKIDAVFASHSHYDHVIDAPMIAKHAGALFYVDASSEIIAKAYQDSSIKTLKITNLQKVKIGNFTITPILRAHSKIKSLGNFEFQPGPVHADFNFNFWDYKVGDTWFYLIEHPEGSILADQGSNPFLERIKPFTSKIDALIQGVANRESDDSILKGYAAVLKPKIFVPSHFDNFFLAGPKADTRLPGVQLEELLDKLQKAYPEMSVVTPRFNEKIVLLKGD